MSVRNDYFETTIAKDFYEVFCGEHLGFGIGRQVFVCNIDPTLVVKIEVGRFSFQNQAEYELWDNIKKTKLAKWFAPVVRISPCGMVMVQKRTMPIQHNTKMPKAIPAIMGDIKKENWGLLNGKVVCHDYGRMNTLHAGWKALSREKKANWWSQKDGHFAGVISGNVSNE